MSATQAAMTSDVLKTRVGVLTNLTPRASLTSDTLNAELADAASASLRQGDVQLVVDLGSVQVLNSKALETLADIQDQAARLGGWLKLAQANPVVADIIKLTGFTRYVGLMDATAGGHPASAHKPVRLGDILVARGVLSEEQVETAIRLQKTTSLRMGQIIIDKGWASEMDVMEALGEQLGVPVVRLRAGIYDLDVVGLVERKVHYA